MGQKIFWVRKKFRKKFWVQKNFWKKIFGSKMFLKILGPRKFWARKKVLGYKKIWKRNWGKINFGSGKIVDKKKNYLKKTFKKILGPRKFLGLTNFWNIFVHKNYDPKNIGSKKFGQIFLFTTGCLKKNAPQFF